MKNNSSKIDYPTKTENDLAPKPAGPGKRTLVQRRYAGQPAADARPAQLRANTLFASQPSGPTYSDTQLSAARNITFGAGNDSQVQLKESDSSNSEAAHSVGSSKTNNTGLPTQLKTGIEQLSGYSMDDVSVHYNSSKPAQLQAHAYAQGTDIHVASGQEKHLPHEAWHVVQQKQGRVTATVQRKGGVAINDDAGLEHEADLMGDKAMALSPPKSTEPSSRNTQSAIGATTQRVAKTNPTHSHTPVQGKVIQKMEGLVFGGGI